MKLSHLPIAPISFPSGPFYRLVTITLYISCHRFFTLCHTYFSKENQVQTYMHARIKFHTYSDIKVYIETVSRKKGDYQSITLNPGNEGSKHQRQSTGGSVCLELSNIFSKLHSSFLLLSNIVVLSKCGERMNAKAL
jgi:amino acid permease